MDYIRFHEVCKVVLSGNTETTDSKGNAYFKSLKIERGPEALYTFQYSTKIDEYTEIFSESFTSYVSSHIYELESLNTLPTLESFVLDEPLKVQPSVRITDEKGNPIQGKRVLAFSWIEPVFSNSKSFTSSPSNLKYLTLENYISEPSDENGISTFKDLKIVGSNGMLAYIHLYAEGVSTPWTDRMIFGEYDDTLPPRAIYPIVNDAPAYTINILNETKKHVIEGQKFSFPVSITVQNLETVKPVQGIQCFVNMHKINNLTIPLGYQSTLKNHPVKYLQNPIPGTYSKNADDPETQDLIIEQYKMTDEDGKVTFDDLKLSQSGPIGNFTLSFTCGNNVVNAIHDVEVRTSIEEDKIKFTQQLPKEVLVGGPESASIRLRCHYRGG